MMFLKKSKINENNGNIIELITKCLAWKEGEDKHVITNQQYTLLLFQKNADHSYSYKQKKKQIS